MTSHEEDLRWSADFYREANKEAKRILVEPRDLLAQAVRAAYQDGMKKSDILRAIDHVWSRQWLDVTLKDS